ncbi:MAG: hypothetical protein AB9869_17980 [Verrucomicrobiia bacterium]
MDSPQSETERWEKLIRSVRGSRAAKVWYLYKTGRLASAVRDQDHLTDTDEPGPRAPDAGYRHSS